jgi:hypothetical protein
VTDNKPMAVEEMRSADEESHPDAEDDSEGVDKFGLSNINDLKKSADTREESEKNLNESAEKEKEPEKQDKESSEYEDDPDQLDDEEEQRD